MARLTIHFVPRSDGEPLLFRVALWTDEDATPREHEQQHRCLVGALFPGLALAGGGPAHIVVERERPVVESVMLPSDDSNGYQVIDIG
jgi:hypothetical protein